VTEYQSHNEEYLVIDLEGDDQGFDLSQITIDSPAWEKDDGTLIQGVTPKFFYHGKTWEVSAESSAATPAGQYWLLEAQERNLAIDRMAEAPFYRERFTTQAEYDARFQSLIGAALRDESLVEWLIRTNPNFKPVGVDPFASV
jgi:hypothetical protein